MSTTTTTTEAAKMLGREGDTYTIQFPATTYFIGEPKAGTLEMVALTLVERIDRLNRNIHHMATSIAESFNNVADTAAESTAYSRSASSSDLRQIEDNIAARNALMQALTVVLEQMKIADDNA